MGMLETKRNMMMNSVASGGLTNLLDGVSYEENKMLDASGNAVSNTTATAYKMVVFDYIETDYLDSYFYNDIFTNPQTQTMYICFYDENKSLVGSRIALVNNNTATEHKKYIQSTTANVKYFRISPRTFGSISVGMFRLNDLANSNINVEVE